MDHDSLFFLLLVLLTVPTEGSYCMSTDCINTGSYQHGGLSLYLRVCCNITNLGQSVTISEPGINRYILCPKVLPKSCPKEIPLGTYTVIKSIDQTELKCTHKR